MLTEQRFKDYINGKTSEKHFPEFYTTLESSHVDTIDTSVMFQEALAHKWSGGRAAAIEVQKNTFDIGLIRGDWTGTGNINHCQDVTMNDYQTFANFPVTLRWLLAFASKRKASLERAMFVKLPPGMDVLPHVDKGLYYLIRHRYHAVIESAGSEMWWGTTMECWRTGEVYWFNNKLRHHSKNSGEKDRIHLIFDLLPTKHLEYKAMIKKVLQQ